MKYTVKLKIKTVRSTDPNYGKHAEIVKNRRGGYELLFPVDMTEKLKRYDGKDFEMDVVKEGETLRVILTHHKESKELADKAEAVA